MKKKLYYILIIALLIYSALLFYWMLFGFNRQVLSTYHFNFIPFATMKRFLAAEEKLFSSATAIKLFKSVKSITTASADCFSVCCAFSVFRLCCYLKTDVFHFIRRFDSPLYSIFIKQRLPEQSKL